MLERVNTLLQFMALTGSVNGIPEAPVTLLGRIPFKLTKVEARPSPVHGTGVFAVRDIKQGELVTLYPGDAVMKVVGSGAQAAVSDKLAKFCGESVDMVKLLEGLRPYRFNVTETIAVLGFPKFDKDPAYLGHLVNDGAATTDEETYAAATAKAMNCRYHVCAKKGHVAIVATRDVKEGEELFASYGSAYWASVR